jgi:metallo-beta-lactamase class B
MVRSLWLVVVLTSSVLAAPPDGVGLAKACGTRDGWSDPAPPARLGTNTWYVGTCGISVILVTSPRGHVLIDAGPPDAAPLVLANITALGFKPKDVKWLLFTHEHQDHVGALASLQQATGAQVAALASARAVVERGQPSADDPQFGVLERVAPVTIARTLNDQDTIELGGLTLTVHETPVHAPGSASWTWKDCDANARCRAIAYADSATTISSDTYRFIDHPDRLARVRLGLSRLSALACDVLLTPHPSSSRMFERLSGAAPLVDAEACRAYAKTASERFDERLAKERTSER